MMIKGVNAVITHRTMRTSGRSIKFACNTPFHSHRNSINFRIFIQRSTKFIFLIFIRWCYESFYLSYHLGFFFNSNIQINLLTFWNDTGIHECGECKVGDNEESNETLIGWYPFVVVNVVLTWIVEKGECRAKKQQPGKCCWYHSCLHIFFSLYLPNYLTYVKKNNKVKETFYHFFLILQSATSIRSTKCFTLHIFCHNIFQST